MSNSIPNPPTLVIPSEGEQHFDLYTRVRDTLLTLPVYFQTKLSISGIPAPDLYNIGSLLGAAIEGQVVKTLNELRNNWDVEREYSAYSFVRQPQTFPDVVLKTAVEGIAPRILMGIELKSWYVLAKEKEPSFRYRVTPGVCSVMDLLAVYPWALSDVVSGSPKIFQPYVTGAKYAAEYRNWHWQYKKTGGDKNSIHLSVVTSHYPVKSDLISDVATNDNGGNFGRFARSGLMDEYIADILDEELSGIPLSAWQKFLTIFSENQSEDLRSKVLNQMSAKSSSKHKQLSPDTLEEVKIRLQQILDLLENE
jgi:hypothetical protein